MINWDRFRIKKKYILLIFCILIALILFAFIRIIQNHKQKLSYTEQLLEIVEKSENPTFAIDKIYVSSSANAVDNTLEQKMNDLQIYQYTDMAIYINNFKKEKGLSNKNTIKQLYIDNINLLLNEPNIGTQSLAYTNLLKIGNRDVITDFSSNERIDFNIIYTNEQNENADYEKPTFYTDCSNPISLKYINNFEKKYSIKNDEAISFDGSLLKVAGISVEDIKCKVIFRINVVNNEDEYSSCWINLNIPLSEIYKGTSIKTATPKGQNYEFF